LTGCNGVDSDAPGIDLAYLLNLFPERTLQNELTWRGDISGERIKLIRLHSSIRYTFLCSYAMK